MSISITGNAAGTTSGSSSSSSQSYPGCEAATNAAAIGDQTALKNAIAACKYLSSPPITILLQINWRLIFISLSQAKQPALQQIHPHPPRRMAPPQQQVLTIATPP